MKIFKDETLLEIYTFLEKKLVNSSTINFLANNPDTHPNALSIKSWADTAEIFKCKLLTPKIVGNQIKLTFKKLNQDNSFHNTKTLDKTEKYGVDSLFFNIDKNSHPYFIHSFIHALKLANVANREQILNLGINKADEFRLIKELLKAEEFNQLQLTGIDHSKTAIEYAKSNFPHPNCNFIAHDINRLLELPLPKQDLIISIGTLQSPSINYKPLLMQLVQEHLKKKSAIILGFPNSRWIEDTLIYGAKIKNYSFSEMGLLLNDIIFAKKYLQQKKFKVYISGREYLFLTAYRE